MIKAGMLAAISDSHFNKTFSPSNVNYFTLPQDTANNGSLQGYVILHGLRIWTHSLVIDSVLNSTLLMQLKAVLIEYTNNGLSLHGASF
jgi:hypothetical protein